MSLPMSIELSALARDHQEAALFQTRVLFWAYFVGAWGMCALGLIPIGYLLITAPQPLSLKITGLCLGGIIEMFSLCFARGLKQTRKWLDNHYDRLRSDERLLQAWQLVDSIDDHELRNRMKAEMAKSLFSDESQTVDAKSGIRDVLRGLLFPTRGV